MTRAVLDRAVIALAAIAALALVAVWLLISAFTQANDRLRTSAPETPEDQRWLDTIFFLTYLLTPGITALCVAALVGLPLVIGARAAALRRAR